MKPTPEEIYRHEEEVAKFLAEEAFAEDTAERCKGLLTSEKLILALGMHVVIDLSDFEPEKKISGRREIVRLNQLIRRQIYLEGNKGET